MAEQRRAAEEKKAQNIKEIEERQKAGKAAHLMLKKQQKKGLAKQKKGKKPAMTTNGATFLDSVEEETGYLEIFLELLDEEARLVAMDIILDAGSSSSSSSSSEDDDDNSVDDTKAPALGGKASLSVSLTPEVVDRANTDQENYHANKQQTMLKTEEGEDAETGVKNSRVSIDSDTEDGQRILDRACREIKDVREARAQQVEGKTRMAATAATAQGSPVESDVRLSARDKAVHQYIDAYMQRQHVYVANFMDLPFISPNPELPPPMQQQMLTQFRHNQQAYCDQYLLNQQVGAWLLCLCSCHVSQS